jgi:hypothetical protein
MTIIDKIKDVFHKDKPTNSTASTSGSGTNAKDTTAPAPSPLAAATTSSNPSATPTAGADTVPANPALAAAAASDVPTFREERAFDKDGVTVIFVLGGPGAGECMYNGGASSLDVF